MFYNTGISTYIWLVTNRKAPQRMGKIQLINGVEHFRRRRKSLGNKRKELGPKHIDAFIAREVLPHVPDAWMDRSKIKVGYEPRGLTDFNPDRSAATKQ
jgi:hypothetical protein